MYSCTPIILFFDSILRLRQITITTVRYLYVSYIHIIRHCMITTIQRMTTVCITIIYIISIMSIRQGTLLYARIYYLDQNDQLHIFALTITAVRAYNNFFIVCILNYYEYRHRVKDK